MKELVEYIAKFGVSKTAAEKAINCRYKLWHHNGEIGPCVLTKTDLEIFGEVKPPKNFPPLLIAG